MRVILDTNVLVSGVFFGGVPGRILSVWSAGKFALVLSPEILARRSRARAETFTFRAQQTMHGGKHIATGHTILVFASPQRPVGSLPRRVVLPGDAPA